MREEKLSRALTELRRIKSEELVRVCRFLGLSLADFDSVVQSDIPA